jgi:hypothetical protein
METAKILEELREKLNRINQAISTFESLDGTVTATTPAAKAAPAHAKKRGLTPAARKRMSEAAKKRWAERKATTALIDQTVSKKASGRRKMSFAARKKIAAAQRKRWAAIKKAKSA